VRKKEETGNNRGKEMEKKENGERKGEEREAPHPIQIFGYATDSVREQGFISRGVISWICDSRMENSISRVQCLPASWRRD